MITRRPSARCLLNTITLEKVQAWTSGYAAGRKFTLAAPSQPIKCSVQAQSSETSDEHGRQAMVTKYEVLFADDYGLDIRDEVLWGGLTLVVTGVRNAAGRSRTFVIDAELRT